MDPVYIWAYPENGANGLVAGIPRDELADNHWSTLKVRAAQAQWMLWNDWHLTP